MKFKIVSLFVLCAILISCGTSRQGGKKQRKGTKAQVVLTPEQQRKYDYFFLEASRLKMKDDYSAAFDLLQHCLTINPTYIFIDSGHAGIVIADIVSEIVAHFSAFGGNVGTVGT